MEEIFHKKRKVFSRKTNRRQLLRKTLGEMVAPNEHKVAKLRIRISDTTDLDTFTDLSKCREQLIIDISSDAIIFLPRFC